MITDTLVADVVEKIAGEIRPVQVILFGSRARGDNSADSDIDILVLYDGPLSKREVKLRIRRLFPRPDFSMDIFVLSPDEFERQKKVVSTVGRIASREGVLYYG